MRLAARIYLVASTIGFFTLLALYLPSLLVGILVTAGCVTFVWSLIVAWQFAFGPKPLDLSTSGVTPEDFQKEV